jgi:hypothetical protein
MYLPHSKNSSSTHASLASDGFTSKSDDVSFTNFKVNSGTDGIGMEASVGISLGDAVGVGDEEGVGVFEVWFG